VDKKALVIVILAGLLLWQITFPFAKPPVAKPPIGRFVHLAEASVWSDTSKYGYFGLNIMGSALAFDTATGQICLTNAEPELVGLHPVLVPGPDGKPEPLADPNTGQPQMRKLPICSELARH
jgi:hypothetical protein